MIFNLALTLRTQIQNKQMLRGASSLAASFLKAFHGLPTLLTKHAAALPPWFLKDSAVTAHYLVRARRPPACLIWQKQDAALAPDGLRPHLSMAPRVPDLASAEAEDDKWEVAGALDCPSLQ